MGRGSHATLTPNWEPSRHPLPLPPPRSGPYGAGSREIPTPSPSLAPLPAPFSRSRAGSRAARVGGGCAGGGEGRGGESGTLGPRLRGPRRDIPGSAEAGQPLGPERGRAAPKPRGLQSRRRAAPLGETEQLTHRGRAHRTAEDVTAGMGRFPLEPWLQPLLSPAGLALAAALLLLVLCLRGRRTR